MRETNPYKPIDTIIGEVIKETPTIKTFILKPKQPIEFEAGQFVELTVPGIGEAPFTPSSSPYQKEKMEVTIMDVGMVTSALHRMRKGEMVGLRGPYGIGYDFSKFEGKEVLIVGGGVGLAPLRSILLALLHDIAKFKKVLLRYGARTPGDIVYKKGLEKWSGLKELEVVVTVDIGTPEWKGPVGVVTTILDKLPMNTKEGVAMVCGPPIMMKFTTIKLLDTGFSPENIYLSMEKNMSCGLGKCGHCMLGKYLVCKDGPVFTWEQIKDIPEPF